ncbi:uncharacterized protein LOC101850175 [Aplysia californica]|uniref:Uncharacterized protein LOC101850175 n=1 Tax=Aplysia californica TaxID=6500 RepID=A0ABM0JQZ8_APLCA|nr:uncharacterized protein LOC101850175 [Aplysia californica]
MPSCLLWSVVATVLLCPLIQTQGNDSHSCDQGHYFDFRKDFCRPCSPKCPDNQIIKIPCAEFTDLQCEPFIFKEISGFDVGTIISYPNSLDKSLEDNNFNVKNKGSNSEKSKNRKSDGPTTVEKEDQEYWKALAFALIGLLSVLIVATVVVLFACCRLQRAAAAKQQDDGEMDDTDSGYVVIRAIRNIADPRPGHPDPCILRHEELASHSPLLEPTSDYGGSDTLQEYPSHRPLPAKLCFLPKVYNPQRRLLNYDTDDVFESDDSGGSVRFSSQSKLKTIPEKSDPSSYSKSKGNSTHVV